MSGISQSQHSAMSVAEWKAEAAMLDLPFHKVAIHALKARMLEGKANPAEQAWRDISIETRAVILAMTVERKTRSGIQWNELNENEQIAVGAFARRLARELGQTAGRLR